MSTSLAVTHSAELVDRQYNDEQIKLIRDVYAKGATEHEFRLFIEVAKRKGLDIFQRQIHLVKRWDAKAQREVCEIQTGIDGYRLIADRTGRYEGQVGPYWCGDDGQWVDVWLHPEPPRAAKVGIWRSNCREPFWGIALYSEYVQTFRDKQTQQVKPNPMWARMPAAQLAKCAEALALRKAFPAEMSGIYTSEEMAQASNPVIDIEPATPTTRPAITAPTAPVVIASPEQIEALQVIRDGLRDYDVTDDKLTQAISNISGNTSATVDSSTWTALTDEAIERVIFKLGARLNEFDAASSAAAANVDAATEADVNDGPVF